MARIAASNAFSAARRGGGSGLLISHSLVCGRMFPNYSAMSRHLCAGASLDTFKWKIGLKPLLELAPRAGFEPATQRLTAACSTTELPGNGAHIASGPAICKAPSFRGAAIAANPEPTNTSPAKLRIRRRSWVPARAPPDQVRGRLAGTTG